MLNIGRSSLCLLIYWEIVWSIYIKNVIIKFYRKESCKKCILAEVGERCKVLMLFIFIMRFDIFGLMIFLL